MTLNGNDANNYLNDPQDYQWDIHSKMSFYDLQASVSDAPVFDFENHVIRDRDDNYGGEEMVRHVASDIWQGTLHGRGGSTLWVWERTYDDSHDFSGSILNRPDVVAETSRTMLDIGRLTEELTAIEKSAKRIGILYSKAARVYSNYYTNSLTTAYEAAVYSGEKVDFVTPKQITNGKLELSDIDILIVPESSNVEDGTLEGIYEFVKNGGKVIISGRNSLSANQYNKPLPSEMRDYIFSSSTVFETSRVGAYQLASPSAEDIWNAVLKLKNENGIGSGLEIRNAETGEAVYGIACQSVFENGRLLVNICNYVYDSMPEVRLSIGGKAISMVKELRSGRILTDKLTLTPYEPILLEYKPAVFDDIYGHWAESAVSELAGTGIVSGVGEGRFEPDRYITAKEFIAMTENAADMALPMEKTDAEISRATAAEILSETCAKKSLTGGANVAKFSDENDIPNLMAVAAAAANGLMFGYPDGSFRPNEKLTRAEAAAVIQRLAYILN